jgi:tetratricopeptide (TPR) repeat protein
MLARLAVALVSVTLAGQALAASQQDWDQCQGNDPARAVQACDSIISDQSETAQNRVDAYVFRASAYLMQSDFDRAITNYSEAIKLDPQNVVAYLSRAVAYFHKGDRDHAILDYSFANALDSKAAARIATNNKELEPIIAAARASPPPAPALAAAVDAAKREATAKQQDFSESAKQRDFSETAEKDFVDAFTKVYKYSYPKVRAAIALGFSEADLKNSPDEVRSKLKQFQSDNHLVATGYLDSATFAALIEQPVDVTKFTINPLADSTPVPVDDWLFSHDKDGKCVVWTKPVAIIGRFLSNFNELPLVQISRFPNSPGDAITQNYGPNDLYSDVNDVYLSGTRKVSLFDMGGLLPRPISCYRQACSARPDAIQAVKDASKFSVIGPSILGGTLTITYSSIGFLSAYQRMNSECAGGRIGSWIR